MVQGFPPDSDTNSSTLPNIVNTNQQNQRNAYQLNRSQFHSNDGQVLQSRIRELQAELDALMADEQELDRESESLREETEHIKRQNKALFEQITASQERQMLQGMPATTPQTTCQLNRTVCTHRTRAVCRRAN